MLRILAHLDDVAPLSVVVHNGHRSLFEGPYGHGVNTEIMRLWHQDLRLTESLDNALLVVITSSGCLAPLEQSREHDLLGGSEEQHEGGLNDLNKLAFGIFQSHDLDLPIRRI